MSNDLPDWTRKVEVAVTVEKEIAGQIVFESVVPEPDTDTAAGDMGNYSGVDEEYQTTASWTITANKTGELKEILIISSNYDKTLIQILIAGVVFVNDWSPQAAMPIIFEDLRLTGGAEVEVAVCSSDGTEIDVDVNIIGKEIG